MSVVATGRTVLGIFRETDVPFMAAGLAYYAGSAGKYAAYGLLGAVLLLVTFLYLAAVVLLVGAALNVAVDRDVVRSVPSREPEAS